MMAAKRVVFLYAGCLNLVCHFDGFMDVVANHVVEWESVKLYRDFTSQSTTYLES